MDGIKKDTNKAEYKYPPIEIFADYEKPERDFTWQKECVEKLIAILDRLKINAKIVCVTPGTGSVSAFVFQSTAFKTMKHLAEEIEYNLDTGSKIRITENCREYKRGILFGTEAYFNYCEGVYTKPFMRVSEEGFFVTLEIPSPKASAVGFKEAFKAPLFMQQQAPCLAFPLGKNIEGGMEVCNLEDMPHLLIAGSGGSGKSICINSMIAGLAVKNSPEDLRLLLIDPKRVELSVFENLPHSLTKGLICEPEHAINALNWVIAEMNRRFDILCKARVADIKEYNNSEAAANGSADKMPYIVIMIDELADLMFTCKKEAEQAIYKLCQKGRAAGIHLVISTQRPTADILSGIIRANFLSRIAFHTSSYIDSRMILETSGAEKLIGRGDMLYLANGSAEPKRIQGCIITNKEITDMVDFLIKNNQSEFDPEIEKEIFAFDRRL